MSMQVVNPLSTEYLVYIRCYQSSVSQLVNRDTSVYGGTRLIVLKNLKTLLKILSPKNFTLKEKCFLPYANRILSMYFVPSGDQAVPDLAELIVVTLQVYTYQSLYYHYLKIPIENWNMWFTHGKCGKNKNTSDCLPEQNITRYIVVIEGSELRVHPESCRCYYF